MIVAIGEINVKKIKIAPKFISSSNKIRTQALLSKGIVKVELHNRGLKTFFSFTIWENEEAMKNFAHSDQHWEAMKNVSEYSENFIFHYYESDTIPTFEEALGELKKQS